MKFLGKMYFKIILKVTRNQGLTLSPKDTFFEKPQGGGGQIDITYMYKTSIKIFQIVSVKIFPFFRS